MYFAHIEITFNRFMGTVFRIFFVFFEWSCVVRVVRSCASAADTAVRPRWAEKH